MIHGKIEAQKIEVRQEMGMEVHNEGLQKVEYVYDVKKSLSKKGGEIEPAKATQENP